MLATASVGESCHRYGQGRCKGKKGVSEMCICGPPRFAHREPPHAPQVAVLVIGRLTLLSPFQLSLGLYDRPHTGAVTLRQSGRRLLMRTQWTVSLGQGSMHNSLI